MCSQKFDLHVWFNTLLNAFLHVQAYVHMTACLSWKGLSPIVRAAVYIKSIEGLNLGVPLIKFPEYLSFKKPEKTDNKLLYIPALSNL